MNDQPTPPDDGQRHRPRRIARPHAPAPLPESPPERPTPPPAQPTAPPSAGPPPPVRRRTGGALDSRVTIEGRGTRSKYVRVMTTETKGGFRRRASGVLEATPEATRARGTIGSVVERIKAVLLGQKLSTSRLMHERLSKVKALAVFSSDALSSSAYATEEILIVLLLAGTGNLGLSVPIGAAIVVLLGIVTISYRQTIRAYPNGGGAYIVAKENLGERAGLSAAGALLVDYILTVSVSVAAGIAAIIAALPQTAPYRIEMGIVAIAVVTLLNLRGVSESGTIFAIPTYSFLFMGFSLLAFGVFRYATDSVQPVAYPEAHAAVQGLSLFLILRAFSSGCTALSGVEAISNGVPAFKEPEAKNAATTLLWMAGILAILFFGITLLANAYRLQEAEGATIVSQLGRQVFGGENILFYFWQASTALILLLAANTAFADFPRLASLLAKDSYMPRQFTFRGDRLAYSNGIIVLGIASIAILVGFGGEVTRLIPLYAIGVFFSFTLSQGGMVQHWRREPYRSDPSATRSKIINGMGAVATFLVTTIIVITKFTHGAWMSIGIGIALFFLFRAVSRHYQRVDELMALPSLDAPLPLIQRSQTVLVPVRTLNRPVVRALAYARSISNDVTALHVTDDVRESQKLQEMWERWAGDVPLTVIESEFRSFTQPILSYIDLLEDRDPETVITVVLPEFVPNHWWQSILHNQEALRLKAQLLFRRDTVVIDVPQHMDAMLPGDPHSHRERDAGHDPAARGEA